MRTAASLSFVLALLCWLPTTQAQDRQAEPIRIGMIGLDTSHVPAFTGLFNDPKNTEGELAGFKVVAGFPGGTDVPASYKRVKIFTEQIRDKYGVEIVDSIDTLVKKVDVVMIESVDGRPHLEQAIPALKAGKKIFIDKPIAGSLADVLMLFELSKKYGVPIFSSSNLRFASNIQAARNNREVGKILGCITYGPCELETYQPELFWYGVHGIEALYALMGTGCKSVTRAHTKETDVVTGVWNDGRIGTYRGLRSGKKDFGAVVFGAAKNEAGICKSDYKPLVVEIAKFFRTGQAPVSAEETIELFAFMEAADESKRQGGAPVQLDSVLQKARAFNKTRKLP